MFTFVLKVGNAKGVHLNPATKIVRFALKNPDLNIRLKREDKEVKADSIMGILSLELAYGVAVKIIMDKKDDEAINFFMSILVDVDLEQ